MSATSEASAERQPPATRDRTAARAALWDFAHLAVLTTFALAQPLFDLLKDNPEFFAARGAPGFDIVSFAVLLVLVPPALMLAVELLVGLIDVRVRQALHLVFIATLVALIAAQALKKAIDASDAVLIVLSVAIGLGAAAAYLRSEPVRSFLSVLSPAPVLFLVIFLFFSPVEKLAFPSEATAKSVGGVARAPIVVVLFDEFPSLSLMDGQMHVDAKRFPAFGELARRSTWFRNAYGVYDSTERAQPAIMDGNYPAQKKLPTSADHPNSIFTLFGKTHRLDGSEEATSVCPPKLCKDERNDESYPSRMKAMADDLGLVWLHVVAPPKIERDLPSVSENWGNFGGGSDTADDTGGGHTASTGPDAPNTRSNLNRNRNKRFVEWINKITPGHRPILAFKHTLLPHVPWQYLPDARQYRRTANDPIPQISRQAYKDPGQIGVLWQRHLLQLGFADHLLGELIAHLKRTGMWDKALVVVAADHGVAFRVNRFDRRRLVPLNAADIGSIPFFIKAPGQKRGRISDALAESVDILPTIFDVLNLNPRVHMDGKSAFSPTVRRRNRVRFFQRGSFKPLVLSRAEWLRKRAEVLQRKLTLFGTGSEGPLRIFRIGPNQQLLNHRVSDYSVGKAAGLSAQFIPSDEYGRVDLKSPTVPAWVTGKVNGDPKGTFHDIAVAVNGRIEAVGNTFKLANADDELFSVMVPPASFRQGRNKVELFEVQGGTSLLRIGSVD